MTEAFKKRPTLKLWQLGLFGLLCVAVFAFLARFLIVNAQFYPIQIDPTGLSDVEVAALEEAVAPLGKVQFFGADLTQIHTAVTDLSWVQSASVSRDFQRGVVVSATARTPIANYGSDKMLDANGVAFTPADSRALMDTSMVYLHGRDTEAVMVMRRMHRINTWFAPLNMRAKDLILTPRQTWIVVFDNGIRVVVDHEDTEQKLYNFSVQLASNLAKELPNIQAADLRYKNGFTIAYKK